MVAEKQLRFQGKNRDLAQLASQIEQQLRTQGYKTQSTKTPLGNIVQAQKAGVLRDIVAADRSFTIAVAGQPDDFSVHIGIGKWVQNLGVTAAETILLSGLFLAVDVPEMLWTMEVENGLAKQISQMIN
jgi:hypothetical protein